MSVEAEVNNREPTGWKKAYQTRKTFTDAEGYGHMSFNHGHITVEAHEKGPTVYILDTDTRTGLLLHANRINPVGEILEVGHRNKGEAETTQLAVVREGVIYDLRDKDQKGNDDLPVIDVPFEQTAIPGGSTNEDPDSMSQLEKVLKEIEQRRSNERRRKIITANRLSVQGGDVGAPIPRNIPLPEPIPQRASRYYVQRRARLRGPSSDRGPTPHPTWMEDAAYDIGALKGRVEHAIQIAVGAVPGPAEGWGDADTVLSQLGVDPHPSHLGREGRATLGEFAKNAIAAQEGRGVLITGQSREGKTTRHLLQMLADWQGLAIVWVLKGELLDDSIDARSQWGPVEILSLAGLQGEAREKYGGYTVSWPVMEKFKTWRGSLNIVNDLAYEDPKLRSKSNGDSHAGYWLPNGVAVAAALGHAISINGGDISDFVRAAKVLGEAMQVNATNVKDEEGQIPEPLHPSLRKELQLLLQREFDDIGGAIATLNTEMMGARNMLHADNRNKRIRTLDEERKNLEAGKHGVESALLNLEQFGALHPRTASVIASVATTIVNAFEGHEVLEATSYSDHMLDTTDLTPRTVYLYGSASVQKNLGSIMRLAHNDVAKTVGDKHNQTFDKFRPHVGAFIDELTNGTPLYELEKFVTLLGGLGMAHFIGVQLGQQIIDMYGELGLRALLANMDVLLLGGSDPKIVNALNEQLGPIEVWRSQQEGGPTVRELIPVISQEMVRGIAGTGESILVSQNKVVVSVESPPYDKDDKRTNIPHIPEFPPTVPLPDGSALVGDEIIQADPVRNMVPQGKDEQVALASNSVDKKLPSTLIEQTLPAGDKLQELESGQKAAKRIPFEMRTNNQT